MKRNLLLAVVLPGLLLACNQQPSAEQAETQFCNDLAELEVSLVALSQINATSQVRDLRNTRENIADAYQSVRASAAAIEAARVNELQTAYDNFDATVNNISGRETVGDAATDVANSLAEVSAARDRLEADVTCPQ
jgi:hypothetical protein